ncbi:MAG: twin-arginine translocase subunit TatC [Chromatiales bacterium]|jgi:sec-independent protein translocase protein TatC
MSENRQAEVEQPFMSHLLELRDRLLRMILAILVFFIVLFPFANDIYTYVAEPLMSHLPEGTSMIATQVASPFLTPFKMSLMAAIFLAMPMILYQFWSFVAPGLYLHERRMVVPLLVSSVLLFYLGMLFAYFVVFPLVFAFLTGTAPEGVAVMTDITSYLDFVLTLFFAFGIAFEVPIATIVLVWMGVTTPQQLKSKRPYIIVAAFVIGMFLTPPDVISQTLLAMPMWVLFEIGVFFSSTFVRQRKTDEESEAEAEPEAADPQPAAASATAGGGTQTDSTSGVAANEKIPYPADFTPMTEEELDAELDRIDNEDENPLGDYYDDYDDHSGDGDDQAADYDPVDVKLAQVMEYRKEDNLKAARALLYEVLEEGDEQQQRVARNILAQFDEE